MPTSTTAPQIPIEDGEACCLAEVGLEDCSAVVVQVECKMARSYGTIGLSVKARILAGNTPAQKCQVAMLAINCNSSRTTHHGPNPG